MSNVRMSQAGIGVIFVLLIITVFCAIGVTSLRIMQLRNDHERLAAMTIVSSGPPQYISLNKTALAPTWRVVNNLPGKADIVSDTDNCYIHTQLVNRPTHLDPREYTPAITYVQQYLNSLGKQYTYKTPFPSFETIDVQVNSKESKRDAYIYLISQSGKLVKTTYLTAVVTNSKAIQIELTCGSPFNLGTAETTLFLAFNFSTGDL